MALSAPVGRLAIGPPVELDCAQLFTRWFEQMNFFGGSVFGSGEFWGMGYLGNPRFFIILYNTRRKITNFFFKGRLDPSDQLTRSLPCVYGYLTTLTVGTPHCAGWPNTGAEHNQPCEVHCVNTSNESSTRVFIYAITPISVSVLINCL